MSEYDHLVDVYARKRRFEGCDRCFATTADSTRRRYVQAVMRLSPLLTLDGSPPSSRTEEAAWRKWLQHLAVCEPTGGGEEEMRAMAALPPAPKSRTLSGGDLSLDAYTVTQAHKKQLVRLQRGVCAICLSRPATDMDHDHGADNGQIRGVLCNGCNTALGRLGDEPMTALRAAQYLLETTPGREETERLRQLLEAVLGEAPVKPAIRALKKLMVVGW